MATGFAAGGFGEGLSRGFQTGANFVDQITSRNIQRQQLAEQRADREAKLELAQNKQLLDQAKFVANAAQEDIATLATDIRTAVEQNNPAAAEALLKSWTVPLEGAGGRTRLGLRAQNLQAMGIPITEQQLVAQLRGLMVGAKTAEEAAAQERQQQFADVEATAQRFGVSEAQAAQGAGLLPAPQRPAEADVTVPILQKMAQDIELTPGERAVLNQLENKGEQIVVFDRENGQPVAIIGGGAAPLPGGGMAAGGVTAAASGQPVGLGPGLTGTGQFEQDQRRRFIDTSLNRVDQILGQISTDPQDFGVVGSLRGGAQEAVSVLNDLSGFAGQGQLGRTARWLADKINEGFYDPDLPALEVAQRELATNLAILRSNRPGNETRAMKALFDQAMEDVKLTGLTSGQSAAERLMEVRKVFDDERRALIGGLSGGAPQPTTSPQFPGQGLAPPGESVQDVATPEEAAQLPAGTLFRTPDGRVLRRN